MRVYLPASVAGLVRLHADGVLGPAPLAGFAVTAALRAAYSDGDEEELEYAATGEAALASLGIVAADGALPRRVVVAADVSDAAVSARDAGGLCAVTVAGPVLLSSVVSVHVDDADAEQAVRAGIAALGPARAGDEVAHETVEATDDHDLLWYATQELPDLLAELARMPR